MSNSIKLSPKYGVNPSITKCFFCGEDKGVALLGRLKNDAEAPRYIIADYEPCDKCKAIMEKGITFIEASETPTQPGMPPIQQGTYPTGRFFVIKEDRLDKIINNEDVRKDLCEKRKAFIDTETFDLITGDIKQS